MTLKTTLATIFLGPAIVSLAFLVVVAVGLVVRTDAGRTVHAPL